MKADEVRFEFQPLTVWPGEPTVGRRRARFIRPARVSSSEGGYRAAGAMPVGRTITQLRSELAQLRVGSAMILLDTDASQLRRDGLPKSNARVRGPGVILMFEIPNVGAVSYPCDTFDRWEDNLRAITLSLNALRSVNRYGVSKRGEQYRGWKALPPPSHPDMTAREAAEFVARHSDTPSEAIMQYSAIAKIAYRKASQKLHPDAGGSANEFALLSTAHAVLQRYHAGQE